MKQYNRYYFQSGAELVKGKKPVFFDLLVKKIKQTSVVLDLGCGSGELTLRLSNHCKKMVGIDCFSDYIKTAAKDRNRKKIKNTFFKVCDARKIPYKDQTFDLIYSSRGPLSADENFFKEAFRVLKPGGLFIEETIGETDKIEVKKIFNRGQNFPYTSKKIDSVKKILNKFKVNLIYSKNFFYYQKFSSLASVARVLERTPIIPDFNRRLDRESLEKLKLLNKNGEIVLSSHRLWWVGKK